jgi:hypothetical protein
VAEVRPAHRTLDTLAHALDESSWLELAYDVGGNLVRATFWTSPLMTKKIRESLFSYLGGNLNTVTKTQFNADGVAIETLTKTLSYGVGGELVNVDTVRT